MRKIVLVFSVVLLMLLGMGTEKAYAGESYDSSVLDIGLYWYGLGDVNQKYVEGENNAYFDPSKPTIIVFHGWEYNSAVNGVRENFNPNNSYFGTDTDLCDYWIEKGWNVGMFHWDQMADELEIKNAEAKIWTNSTSVGLRWKNSSGTNITYTGTEGSVTEIFVNAYESCFKNYTGSEIRFLGHSLGNQLAINSAKLINDDVTAGTISSTICPDRVALLEPFWTKGTKSYLSGQWTGERCREYVKALKEAGIAFEMYKSSSINDLWLGDSNNEMKKLTAFQDIYPDFASFYEQEFKHCYAIQWYLSSIQYSEPTTTSGEKAISASTSTGRLSGLMDTGYYWVQKSGQSTVSAGDDIFSKVSW